MEKGQSGFETCSGKRFVSSEDERKPLFSNNQTGRVRPRREENGKNEKEKKKEHKRRKGQRKDVSKTGTNHAVLIMFSSFVLPQFFSCWSEGATKTHLFQE